MPFMQKTTFFAQTAQGQGRKFSRTQRGSKESRTVDSVFLNTYDIDSGRANHKLAYANIFFLFNTLSTISVTGD